MFVTQHALLRLTFAQNCVNLKDHYKIVGLNRQALKFVHALNNYTHEAIILTVQLGLTQISINGSRGSRDLKLFYCAIMVYLKY